MSSICPIAGNNRRRHRNRTARGFTLLEVLVGTSVFTLVMFVAFTLVGQAGGIWKRSSETAEAFQSARTGFDLMTRTISQATLNPYLDYDDPVNPTRYLRKSDLHFVCGLAGTGGLPGTPDSGTALFFAVPLGYTSDGDLAGLESALNTCGFYVAFSNDRDMPDFLPSDRAEYRYRLYQVLAPTEESQVFQQDSTNPQAWLDGMAAEYARPVATNVIAVIAQPQDVAAVPLSQESYLYDSREGVTEDPQPRSANQLPPVVRLTMVAIDENSARRLQEETAPPAVITSALAGKFQTPDRLRQDLEDLERALLDANISVRIFSSAIPLREAKWTK